MSGHRVTPYEVTATKKFVRGEKKDALLLLASIGADETVDLLDAIAHNILNVAPITRPGWALECVRAARKGDQVSLVFAVDITGEREVIRAGDEPGRPVRYTKGTKDVATYYACCLLWRPARGTEGILLLHSPWGRGGTRRQVLTLLQRAVTATTAPAKLRADAMIPAKALKRMLDQANATQIIYSKKKGIRSTFGDNTTQASALADMDLVVRGSGSLPYRDALKAALKASANRDKFFTVRVRDDDADGGFRDETFDDVAVDLATGGGVKRYSMKADSVPTVSFDQTVEFNRVYYALPDDDDNGRWADELLEGVTPYLERVLQSVRMDNR